MQREGQRVRVVDGERAAGREGAAVRVRGVADEGDAAAEERVRGQGRGDGEVGVDVDVRGVVEEGADEGVPVLLAVSSGLNCERGWGARVP